MAAADRLLAQKLLRRFEVDEPALERGELLETAPDAAVLGGDLGGGCLVVPEVALGGQLLKVLLAGFQGRYVKDSPGRCPGGQ